MSTKKAEHYQNIAENFDHIWQFSENYEDWMIEQIQQHLALTAAETWLDFGAGTGRFSHRLHCLAQPQFTYCVEPDAHMCEQAKQRDGLCVIKGNDQNCWTHLPQLDAIVLKEVIHHLSHRPHFWQQAWQQLKPAGRLLVVTRPQHTSLALFDAAKQRFALHQPSQAQLEKELTEAGFTLSTHQQAHHFIMSKQKWAIMLKARFMSDLAEFSDEEIDSGIRSLDETYPEDGMSMTDTLIFILASKA